MATARKSQNGFSLTEVIIALALGSMAVYAYLNIEFLRARSLTTLAKSGSKDELRSILRNSLSCEVSLGNARCDASDAPAALYNKAGELLPQDEEGHATVNGLKVRGRCGQRWGLNRLYVEYTRSNGQWKDVFDGIPLKCTPAPFKIPLEFYEKSDRLKLFLIVDDSASMAPRQAQLSAGLSVAFNTLRKKDIDVYLYTTSLFDATVNFFGSSNVNFYELTHLPRIASQFQLWGWYGLSGLTSPTTTHPSLFLNPAVKKDGDWITPSSASLAFTPEAASTLVTIGKSAFSTGDGSLHFTHDMSQAQFDALKSKLLTEVRVGDRGSSSEAPLCTLATLLMNEGPYKVINPGDKAIFLILSDEDQTSAFTCPHRIDTQVITSGTSPLRPYIQVRNLIGNYQALCDAAVAGIYCDQQATHSITGCQSNPLCQLAAGNRACSDAERTLFQNQIYNANAAQFDNGNYRWHPDGLSCTSQVGQSTLPAASVNVPTGSTPASPYPPYSSILNYWTTAFPTEIFTGQAAVNINYGTSVNTVATIGNITSPSQYPAWIRQKAQQLLGSNFSINTIGNFAALNPAGCSLSVSSESQLLGQTSDMKSSICAGDYTESMTWVNRFAHWEMKTTYTMPRRYMDGSYTIIRKVDGLERVLRVSDYSYNRDTETLTLNESVPKTSNAFIMVRRR